MGWIDTWMNDVKNKVALGANPERTFESCNLDVNKAFTLQGDGMHNSALLLPELINNGVRLLVYAGNAGKSEFIRFSFIMVLNALRAFRYDVQLYCKPQYCSNSDYCT